MKKVDKNSPVEVISIYDVDDFSIGHDTDTENITGCTVIVCNNSTKAASGSDVRGGAPGTRNLDIISPLCGAETCHAVVLSGGSCYGLNASGGVEKCLEERGIGIELPSAIVPIVAQAIIYDLYIGNPNVRPDVDMGYRACENAFKREKHPDGNIGAGIGATCGKLLSLDKKKRMKSGLGTYCLKKGDLFVGAVMVVNPCGDVYDPSTNKIIAGALDKTGKNFADTEKYILENFDTAETLNENTTIGCIITNAILTRPQAHKIAACSQNGMARTIRPVHTMADGDTMFCMTSNEVEASLNLVSTMAVIAAENAILNSVRYAESLDEYISGKDLSK